MKKSRYRSADWMAKPDKDGVLKKGQRIRMMGTNAAFDARIHALRPHPGQQAVAANLRALTAVEAA